MGEKDCFLDFVITGFFVLKVIQNERLNKFKQKYCFCDSIQNSTSFIYIYPLIQSHCKIHWLTIVLEWIIGCHWLFLQGESIRKEIHIISSYRQKFAFVQSDCRILWSQIPLKGMIQCLWNCWGYYFWLDMVRLAQKSISW